MFLIVKLLVFERYWLVSKNTCINVLNFLSRSDVL